MLTSLGLDTLQRTSALLFLREIPKTFRTIDVKDVAVNVVAERVIYYNAQGQQITESLKAYTLRTLNREFASLDDFLKRWKAAERKQVIIDELQSEGIFFEALSAELGQSLDPFDLICHLAWGQPPLTRRERAAKVKKRDPFTQYGPQARKVLEALLDKYADQGVGTIEEMKVLQLDPFRQLGTPMELVKAFGNKTAYEAALRDLETQLYVS